MMRFVFWTIALAALSAEALLAQDITGAWQGTLQAGGRELRLVFKIAKGDQNALKGTMYSIDQGGQAIPLGPITQQGLNVKMAIPGIGGSYEGKLNTDATVMTGSWSQGGQPTPLELKHVTGDAIWPIPTPPAPLKPMAADANPVFEVATIKPSQPGTPGKALTIRGREFVTVNTTVSDLITFAYDLHPRQLTGGPPWLESEAYDIVGQPEPEGRPNTKQLKTMIQKLLADRFKLTFHRDKKELSAYALVLAKNGPKMAKNETNPNGLPGLFFRGLGDLPVTNATMADFVGVLQTPILDRPVVDQTGLSGRYDFELKWTPDAAQFGGRGAMAPRDNPDAPPDLFTAIQEQLGLQLKSVKAPVEVLVIDRIEKPSEN